MILHIRSSSTSPKPTTPYQTLKRGASTTNMATMDSISISKVDLLTIMILLIYSRGSSVVVAISGMEAVNAGAPIWKYASTYR